MSTYRGDNEPLELMKHENKSGVTSVECQICGQEVPIGATIKFWHPYGDENHLVKITMEPCLAELASHVWNHEAKGEGKR